MRTVSWLLFLVIFWAGITAAHTPSGVATGLVVALVAVWFIRHRIGRLPMLIHPWHFTVLVFTFIWELIKSAVRVAVQVLSPRLNVHPGNVAIPLSTDQDFEIAVLANLITLTPGTLSVDVSADKSTLYIHALDASDPDAVRRDIKQTFETKIMKAFR